MKITINDQILEANEGESILNIARANGIYIPALCYLSGCSPTLATPKPKRICKFTQIRQRSLLSEMRSCRPTASITPFSAVFVTKVASVNCKI